jgi:hypothetical protein
MPEKEYIVLLDKITRIFVYIYTVKGIPKGFVVKLQLLVNNKWLEIQRYDLGHGYVHKDIFNKSGKKIKVIKYLCVDINLAVSFAVNDLIKYSVVNRSSDF